MSKKMKRAKFNDLIERADSHFYPEELPSDSDWFYDLLGGLWAIGFVGFLIFAILSGVFGII